MEYFAAFFVVSLLLFFLGEFVVSDDLELPESEGEVGHVHRVAELGDGHTVGVNHLEKK